MKKIRLNLIIIRFIWIFQKLIQKVYWTGLVAVGQQNNSDFSDQNDQNSDQIVTKKWPRSDFKITSV